MELEFIDISDRREHQDTERIRRQAGQTGAQQRRTQPRRRPGGEERYRRRVQQPNAYGRQAGERSVVREDQVRRQQIRRQQLKQRQARERYRQKQLRKRRQKVLLMKAAILCCLVLLVVLLATLIPQILQVPEEKEKIPDMVYHEEQEAVSKETVSGPGILEDFLTVNEYSRPGEPLESVNNIFVHYTANPGTSAAQNRSYFENLGLTGETSASAHFVIGYEGEIIQCIPLDEIAYAVQKRNYDSISIECCYLDSNGKFTDATYNSLVELSAWLLQKYNLSPSDMRRHYDEGGKKCPLYFVEHEEAWHQFIRDVESYMADREEA